MNYREFLQILREAFTENAPRSRGAKRFRISVLAVLFILPAGLLCIEYSVRLHNVRKAIILLQAERMAKTVGSLILYYGDQNELPRSFHNSTRHEALPGIDYFDMHDKWGNLYNLETSDDGRYIRILSLGRNGVAGGSGVDADWVYECRVSDNYRWHIFILSSPISQQASDVLNRQLMSIQQSPEIGGRHAEFNYNINVVDRVSGGAIPASVP